MSLVRELFLSCRLTTSVPIRAMAPEWWMELGKRLKRVERSANLLETVKKLHANKIFVPDLLDQLFEGDEARRHCPPAPAQSPKELYNKAELENSYGDPVIAASIFLFNKSLERTCPVPACLI